MPEKSQTWATRITPEDRIYYTRLIFAVFAASLCFGFNFSGLLGIVGFILGIIVIILSYFVAIFLLRVDPQKVGGHGRGLMKGLGTGILLFLILWFLLYNFLIVPYIT